MRKTILLVFIHGFKGGDDTFGTFPDHLRALVSHALPRVNVLAIQYPKFETRGELKECVARLREWLENKVIDLEVANSTPSPTLDPSVHVILIGHSMGGIVAAETLLLLASERPIPSNPQRDSTSKDSLGSSSSTTKSHPHFQPAPPAQDPIGYLFPHVQAVIAFDTPYLGLAPEMVAHGLEGGHKMASNAWDTASEVASMFGWGSKSGAPATANKSIGALPAPPVTNASVDAAAAPRWQSWGKVAMFAGAAGAVAAGGAAALYSQREKLTAGWSWATSHLLFVGDLAKAENLKRRVEGMERTIKDRNLGGCGNFYTNLGRGARDGYGITEKFSGKDRTFCNLPQAVKTRNDGVARSGEMQGTVDGVDQGEKGKLRWMKAVNEKAKDETAAHIAMFFPRDNPGFYDLGNQAKECVVAWIDKKWYEASYGTGADGLDAKGDWEGLDKHEIHGDDEDVEMHDEDKMNEGELEDSVLIETKSASGSGTLGGTASVTDAQKQKAQPFLI